MTIPILLIAFMLSTAVSAAKTQADTAHTIKNISGGKQDSKYLRYDDSRLPKKYNDKNDPITEEKNSHLSIEVRTGAGIPVENYFDSRIVSGFGLTIPLKKRLSFSLDLGYWKSGVEEVPAKFYDGHLKAFPLLASLQFSLLNQNKVRPYAFFSAGYMFCTFEMENIITIPEITIEQKVKSGPCLGAGLGVDVAVSRSFGMLAEATYFYRKAQGITTITDLNFGTSTREFPVNLHAWTFQIGIKYFIKLSE